MTSTRPEPTPPPADEPIGGLLALEAPDELALGAYDDYSDELALGAAEDDLEFGDDDSDEEEYGAAVLSLAFGAQTSQVSLADDDPLASGWFDDIGDVRELSVQEKKGDFGGDGDNARYDVFIMEEEFDPDAEVITAVWEGPYGLHFGTRVRHKGSARQLLPYAILGTVLAGAGVLAFACIVMIAVLSWYMGPTVEVVPLDPADLPKVEIERKPIEEQTADEILKEVLGEQE